MRIASRPSARSSSTSGPPDPPAWVASLPLVGTEHRQLLVDLRARQRGPHGGAFTLPRADARLRLPRRCGGGRWPPPAHAVGIHRVLLLSRWRGDHGAAARRGEPHRARARTAHAGGGRRHHARGGLRHPGHGARAGRADGGGPLHRRDQVRAAAGARHVLPVARSGGPAAGVDPRGPVAHLLAGRDRRGGSSSSRGARSSCRRWTTC